MSEKAYLVGKGLSSEEICKLGIPKRVQDTMLKQLYEVCVKTVQGNIEVDKND